MTSNISFPSRHRFSSLTSSEAAAFDRCRGSMPRVDFLVLKQWLITLHKIFSAFMTRPQKSSGFTSGDPPSALTCGTCHTVPTRELHIRELGDISALPILTVAVLQRRWQALSSLLLAAVWVELGKRLPHNHICQHRNNQWAIRTNQRRVRYLQRLKCNITAIDQRLLLL